MNESEENVETLSEEQLEAVQGGQLTLANPFQVRSLVVEQSNGIENRINSIDLSRLVSGAGALQIAPRALPDFAVLMQTEYQS